MIFVSKSYGQIDYKEENIINFKKGIPGFEDLKKYILIDLKDYEPFKLLQSIDDVNIGMTVISPYDFFEEYEVKLNEDVISSLDIKSQEDVTIVTTVTINSDAKKIATNLQGPIVINNSTKLGEQIILDNSKYKIKEPLMKE